MDIIDTYWPAENEVTPEMVASARSRLETYLKRFDPDVDTRPNTPFGDLHLTNMARLVAADEEAHRRLQSDLDLNNVAEGTIYSCDFVRAYLRNFAVVDQETLRSSGVVRLVFCLDKAYTVDRRARYQFGDDTYEIRLPFPGPLEVLPVGSVPASGTNARVLTQVDEDRFAVDVGVVGTMTAPVDAGTSGDTDYAIADLTSVTALYDFEEGLPPAALPTLAKLARQTYYAVSLTARGPARHYLKKNFGDLTVASPVLTGDPEMIRDMANPTGIGAGYLDAYVQSTGHAGTDSHYITLGYDSGKDKYIGALDLVEAPQRLLALSSAQDADIDMGLGTSRVAIYSASLNPADAPLAQAAYSPDEKLWIAIGMPRTATGEAKLTNTLDGAGNETHRFLVTYEADPMMPVAADDVLGSDAKPVGVNVRVRGLVPVVIEDMVITYTRPAGARMNLDAAKAEILAYLRSLGYPETYSDAKVSDAMYYAGASDVRSIACTAHVQWSVADKFLKDTTLDPTVDLDAVEADAVAAPPVTIGTSKGLIPSYRDPELGTSAQTYVAVGPRNVGYIISDDSLRFSENRNL